MSRVTSTADKYKDAPPVLLSESLPEVLVVCPATVLPVSVGSIIL